MKSSSGSRGSVRLMTQSAASRIQSAMARAGAGQVSRGSFAARAQSAATLHAANGVLAAGGKGGN